MVWVMPSNMGGVIDVRNDPPMTCHCADSPWVVKVVAVTWAAQVALEAPGVVRTAAAADGWITCQTRETHADPRRVVTSLLATLIFWLESVRKILS